MLIVDDQQRVRETTSMVWNAYGFKVYAAADGDEASEVAEGQRCDIVPLDMAMAGRLVSDTHSVYARFSPIRRFCSRAATASPRP